MLPGELGDFLKAKQVGVGIHLLRREAELAAVAGQSPFYGGVVSLSREILREALGEEALISVNLDGIFMSFSRIRISENGRWSPWPEGLLERLWDGLTPAEQERLRRDGWADASGWRRNRDA